jgi:F-type H+-transporting ATPase subunit delta
VRNSVIARRYAKALILIGKEDGKSEKYREELNDFVGLLDNEKRLESAICNPLYTAKNRRNVLQAILDKASLSPAMTSFLLLLFDKGRITFLRDIRDNYNKLADEIKGIVRANLVSATKLSEETFEQIRAALSKMTNKQVLIDTQEDPGLIGGIVTKIGDLVLDGSIRTQLQNMRESLKRGERV